jgi:hypothetical protein
MRFPSRTSCQPLDPPGVMSCGLVSVASRDASRHYGQPDGPSERDTLDALLALPLAVARRRRPP